MIGADKIAEIFAQFFFPRWQMVLVTWLCATPNFEEVSRWYTGWKSLFPLELQQTRLLRTQFSHALEVINASLSGIPLPPPLPIFVPHEAQTQAQAPKTIVAPPSPPRIKVFI